MLLRRKCCSAVFFFFFKSQSRFNEYLRESQDKFYVCPITVGGCKVQDFIKNTLEVKLNQVQLSWLMCACVGSVLYKCLRSPAIVHFRTKGWRSVFNIHVF